MALAVLVLCVVAFCAGTLFGRRVERHHVAQEERHRKEVTRQRRTPARPGTTPATVRTASIDRAASLDANTDVSRLSDRR